MSLLRRLARWYLLRKAAKFESAFPGPYPDGSYGAEVRRLAGNLRKLADEVKP